MIKLSDEVLLGVKIPGQLKENVSEYCSRNGIKIKYFITEAIREKFDDILEDEYDNAVVDERLKDSEFVGNREMEAYFHKKKKK